MHTLREVEEKSESADNEDEANDDNVNEEDNDIYPGSIHNINSVAKARTHNIDIESALLEDDRVSTTQTVASQNIEDVRINIFDEYEVDESIQTSEEGSPDRDRSYRRNRQDNTTVYNYSSKRPRARAGGNK